MVDAYLPRRLHQDPPRHQHGLRRRACRPPRRPDRRARRRPRGRRRGRRRTCRPSTSSAPKSRSPAAPPRPLDHLEVTSPGGRDRDRRRSPPRLRRPRPRRGLRPRDRRRRPARRRVRQRLGRRLPPRGGPRPLGRPDAIPGFVFEAHSTDYQPPAALAALVRDGFAILKVGPALTFALREALYGLDHIAAALDGEPPALQEVDGSASCPRTRSHWRKHLHGTPADLRRERHFGYSDRIRYYWPEPAAQAAVDRLLARLHGRRIPEPLVSQYLGALYPEVAAGRIAPSAEALRSPRSSAC